MRTKLRFILLLKPGATQAPTSKSPEEREFVAGDSAEIQDPTMAVQLREDRPGVLSSDQTREDNSLQDGKFRTSCCPWIVVKFWYQFVFYIGRTHQVHLQLQRQSEVTIRHQETCGIHQKPKTKIKRGITSEHRETVCEIFHIH